MNRVEIREFSYDAFERMIRENGIDNYVVLYCVIKDGQIRQVYMPGSYYGYGSPMPRRRTGMNLHGSRRR